MNPYQIVQLVSRLFAVYLLAEFSVPAIAWLFFPSVQSVVGPLVGILLLGAIAAFFWFYPWMLAIGILPKENKSKPTSPVTLEAVQTLCFAILGTYFCIHAAIPILHMAIDGWLYNKKVSWDNFLFGGIVQFLIGLAVMFGGRGIMGFITRLRNISPRRPTE